MKLLAAALLALLCTAAFAQIKVTGGDTGTFDKPGKIEPGSFGDQFFFISLAPGKNGKMLVGGRREGARSLSFLNTLLLSRMCRHNVRVSTSDALRRALSEAQAYSVDLPAPPNEANTCDGVIRPLLLALGYANHEIHAQAGDVANKFPDYTILPNTEHTWYLEAKAWSVGLDSLHVDQSLNYAHSNGQRWVVLSNGREWRLYDDRIPARSADRHVATANLEDTDGMLKFLGAVSRESMMAKKVESYASERRVREYLSAAITNPSSPVIQAILKVVRQNVGNGPVTAEAIVDILNAQATVSPEQTAKPARPSPTPKPAAPTDGIPVKGATSAAGTYGPLFIKAKGLTAEGTYQDGQLTLRQGSRISKKPAPSYAATHAKHVTAALEAGTIVDRGDYYELTTDRMFRSPSGASDFVLGMASNGWTWWADATGQYLDQLCPRTKEQKWRQGYADTVQ